MEQGKKTRLRAPNFTNNESLHLCEILEKYKIHIENKKTDGPSLQNKHQAWLKVVEEYNSSTPSYSRTLESLQNCYKNIKKKAKKQLSALKTSNNPGVPTEQPKEDPLLNKVCSLVGQSVEVSFSIFDGDPDLKKSPGIDPIESVNIMKCIEKSDTENSEFTNNTSNRSNLKRKLSPNVTITKKEKSTDETVTDKYKTLAEEKMELVKMQKQLIEKQLQVEEERLAHARKETELINIKIKYEQERIKAIKRK